MDGLIEQIDHIFGGKPVDTLESRQQYVRLGAKFVQLPFGQISDGYHTFDELYEFRKMYNVALFNEWAIFKEVSDTIGGPYIYEEPKYQVHKSWRHHDGELCFGGGWFIVSAMLPTGQVSNHYKAEDWDLFKVPEVKKALFEFDGHSSADVLERLKAL